MKNNKKRIVAVCAIILACAGICLGCWFAIGQEEREFKLQTSSAQPTSSWEASELRSEVKPESTVKEKSETEKVLEEYPKTVKESTSEVVIDFTPPVETQSEANPDSNIEPTQPEQPEYQPEYISPPTQEETGGGGGQDTTGGNAGSIIDDPAFGEIYAGQAQQQEVDNDGDPDKMVGTM